MSDTPRRFAITTRGLAHAFGRRRVLDGVDLEVPAGQVTALLGKNGAGKSTLFRILTGVMSHRSGSVRVLGLDPRCDGPTIRLRVGIVPERLELPRWMRVADHFDFLEPFFPTFDRAEVARLLLRLELDPRAKVATLSKGERAKHALVAALAHRPEVLLLDEPFSGLDPIVRHDVLEVVLGHLREDGRTVLLVSHSMADVERIADRVVILDEGKVKFSGDVEDVRWPGGESAAHDLDEVFRAVVLKDAKNASVAKKTEEPCAPSP